MTGQQNLKDICLNLIHADSEAEVVEILRSAGYWDDANAWRWLGDRKSNYSTVGNQASRAEEAIVEKLINSIDTMLIARARIEGCLPKMASTPQAPDTPQTIEEARQRFFGEKLKDVETLSRQITVAATGARPRQAAGRPCFTITDCGEGQTPARLPRTILSIDQGNKDKIKFVQGKFNMGGTGVLEFCGIDHNVQLVVSRRNPELLSDQLDASTDNDWGFTVIRREDPTDGKSSRFTYLAPMNSGPRPRAGDILHFHSDTLPIFPEKNEPYSREASFGTLIKLYEYDAHRFRTNMMMRDGLLHRVRLLLPEPALPIRFHECRAFRGHSGSFDTTMVGLMKTLRDDFENPKRDNVEWFDKQDFDVDGEKFTAHIYLFKNKEVADTYRKDEGIVFTYNGQCHTTLTKDFFRRKKVKQDYLWHSLLMLVDCSRISPRAHEKLFMNSRDRRRDSVLKRRLEQEIEDLLGRHEELKTLASERRKKELSERPKTSDSMAKVIENLLYKNPALAAILGQGFRIKNPHKPESAGDGVAGFIGHRFPTRFHFKAHEPDYQLKRSANINARARITFETDAANDYFRREDEPGEFALNRIVDGNKIPATNFRNPRLNNGFAHLTVSVPDDAKVGDDIIFEALVTDPSRIEPFRNTFTLTLEAERTNTSGGNGGTQSTGSDKGDGKGANSDGNDKAQDSHVDIPEPNEVYEKDWAKQEPNFDKFTVMRIIEPPDVADDEMRYDYFINMDNIYLQSFLKARPTHAPGMKLRYSVGMTLVALSLLHQEQLMKNSKAEDMPRDESDVRDRVAQVTSALAPFLLPMIDSVSELEGEDLDPVSESAGEAA